MGMSDKQLFATIAVLTGIVIYSGFAFDIANKYGAVWGMVFLNILNIGFFIFVVLKSDKLIPEEKKKNEVQNEKEVS